MHSGNNSLVFWIMYNNKVGILADYMQTILILWNSKIG